jgi:UV DNA damage repair endonuclease
VLSYVSLLGGGGVDFTGAEEVRFFCSLRMSSSLFPLHSQMLTRWQVLIRNKCD